MISIFKNRPSHCMCRGNSLFAVKDLDIFEDDLRVLSFEIKLNWRDIPDCVAFTPMLLVANLANTK